MFINNLKDYQKYLVHLFTDYLIRFGEAKRKEIETYCNLTVQGIGDMYAGNGKRGKQKGNRNGHISRWVDEAPVLLLKQKFNTLQFNLNDNQDSVRRKVYMAISSIKGIGTIVYNDLSFLVCLKYGIDMPRLYVQRHSYDSAKTIKECYRLLGSSYFLVKPDKQLKEVMHFIPLEFIKHLIDCIDTFYFEDFLCRYKKPICFLHYCILNKQSVNPQILNNIIKKVS